MKKFSIITICLNIGSEIRNTIASVLEQTSSDFEYIIKDGGSKDNTVGIAKSFASAFSERGIPYRILSQKDSGVYDAMNQATKEATGEWVIYMNAGDLFADKTILEQVEKSGCLEKGDVVYGDRILSDHGLYRYAKAYPLEAFRTCLPFGHQSVFTRRELLGSCPYSVHYRICSDYRCFLRFYRERKRFSYYPAPISIYDVNGISSNIGERYREILRILEEVPQRDEEAIQRIKSIIRKNDQKTWLHQHFFRFIPKKLRLERRRRMRIKEGWKTAEDMFGSGGGM